LKPVDLRRLIIERGEANFETEVAPSAGLNDINWEKAEAYAASLSGLGESDTRKLLIKRGCLVMDGDTLRPTHAGVLLFGKDPQRHIRGAEITAARFAGETMSDTFSRQDILGTLPDQIRRAETFLVDHLRKGVHIRHTMAREENFEYPLEAARELVVNAVAHRDYSITGDGIRLFIFRDHMEISSPGGLPGPVTIDNIKDERFSRNPVIVQVLSDMGFIERLGYGVDRVIDLMRQQKLRAPEFEETAGGFRVLLHNQGSESDDEGIESESATQFKGEYKGIEINPRQEAALIYLHTPGNTRITNSDLQELCPDVHAETIRRDLVDLVTKDILQKMGQKRGSYYVLKRD
jgi:ATP-dependent DNA helicase RecG